MKGKRDTVSRSFVMQKALDILKQALLLSRNDFFFLLPNKIPLFRELAITSYATNRP